MGGMGGRWERGKGGGGRGKGMGTGTPLPRLIMLRAASEAALCVGVLVGPRDPPLRQELAMHDALAGRTGVRHGPLTDPEKARISDVLYSYARGDVDALEFSTMRQVRHRCGGGDGGT